MDRHLQHVEGNHTAESATGPCLDGATPHIDVLDYHTYANQILSACYNQQLHGSGRSGLGYYSMAPCICEPHSKGG